LFGEFEWVFGGFDFVWGDDLLVGVEMGDDVVVVWFDGVCVVVMMMDFFIFVVDDFYDWGWIVVINVLFDVYVMGG